MMTRKPLNFGIGCCFSRCRNSIDNISPTRSYLMAIEETHDRAGKAGWTMGLDGDGQAHNICPEHAGSLFNESPMMGSFTRRQSRVLRLRQRSDIAEASTTLTSKTSGGARE